MEREGFPRKDRYRLVFDVPGLPKGANGQHGTPWAANAERKLWRSTVEFLVKNKRPPEPLTKVALICTRFSYQAPDYDNLVISFKSAIDGLKDAGIIEDDNSKVVVARKYLHERCRTGEGKIRIEVRELKEGDENVCLYCNR